MPARLEPSGLSRSPTLHPHQQLVQTKLCPRQKLFLNIPLTNLIAALAHRSMVTPLARSQLAHGDSTLLDSEFKAGWGQKRSTTSAGCSATAASTTVVEAVLAVWSRARYRQSRKPRAALLRCRSREPYRLIFELGMGLVLSVAALGAW